MIADIQARFVRLRDAHVTVRQYADESTALVAEAVDEDGYPEKVTLSLNLSAYGMNPGEGHVFVGDYSEHEGLPTAMEEAGLGDVIERFTFGPFDTEGALFRLNPELLR